MLDLRHLPRAELARVKRRTFRRAMLLPLKVVGGMLRLRPGRPVLAEACDCATVLGRVGSYLGLRYRYYQRSARSSR